MSRGQEPAFPGKQGGLLFPLDFEQRFPEAAKELKELRWEGGGMTLREWFAGMALKGLLSNTNFTSDGNIGEVHTQTACWLADLILAGLEKSSRSRDGSK